jgi:hypothetical protein
MLHYIAFLNVRSFSLSLWSYWIAFSYMFISAFLLFFKYIFLICLICGIISKAIEQFDNLMFYHLITPGLLIVVHLTIQKKMFVLKII